MLLEKWLKEDKVTLCVHMYVIVCVCASTFIEE